MENTQHIFEDLIRRRVGERYVCREIAIRVIEEHIGWKPGYLEIYMRRRKERADLPYGYRKRPVGWDPRPLIDDVTQLVKKSFREKAEHEARDMDKS